ncbi:MAG TPA: endonuclease/exonuclease/phosphatase family protein [Burkholderiaceae bacterium]
MELRIATYNIHKGVTSFRGMPRIHALKQALSAMEADIIFLQEVQGRHDINAMRHANLWPEQAQHEFLAGDSHHSAYGMNAVYDHGHHGNALLSRHPIRSSRNQDVSDHALEQRGILHCVLQTERGDVHCYVVHLGLFSGGRRRQNQALIECVQASAGKDEPIIIAGDFNDWGNRLGGDLRQYLGVVEVFDSVEDPAQQVPARTFPALIPWLRLDRIYVRGFAVQTAEVLHGAQWARLSDHAPIVATLTKH